ncbi:MAG: type II secretion system F family protein [Pirellulales bacterium]|nr:type II secretion system F family protein [Pirellulales bacterium]
MMQSRWPGFDAMRKLTPEEATEFAARVAELTKAGLPLGSGLRALADELPGGRLPRVLGNIANRMDAGDDLMDALESQGACLSSHLRGLILAGLRSGRLTEVLEEYVTLQHNQSELRRRVRITLAYPFILLLLVTGLAVFFGFFAVPMFVEIFLDFEVKLPFITMIVVEGSRPLACFLMGLIGLLIALPFLLQWMPLAGWAWPALYYLPMIGSLLRWSQLAQFSRLMGLLLEQDVALSDALRITAAGLRDASLARGCRLAAKETERGYPLAQSLTVQRRFPTSMTAMIHWGQQANALPDAFHGITDMIEGRIRSQGTLFEAMLLPIMLLGIVLFIGIFVIAMFMPLISLIDSLSGG